LYAEDPVVIAETEDDLIKRLNEGRMENRGMRVNMNKTTSHTHNLFTALWVLSG